MVAKSVGPALHWIVENVPAPVARSFFLPLPMKAKGSGRRGVHPAASQVPCGHGKRQAKPVMCGLRVGSLIIARKTGPGRT
jgi:hypothetical protein